MNPLSPIRVAIVIPAYDAERSIGQVLDSIPGWVHSVIVVNDGSSDRTPEIAIRRHASVLDCPENRGVGAAMRAGYELALISGADIVVKMDSDGQMSAGDLPALLMPILARRADYTKGNRTGRWRSMPPIRRLGTIGLSWLLGIPDPVNGYIAITRQALERIVWGRIHSRYGFEITMLIEATRVGLRIENVPMVARYGSEWSHLNPWRCLWEFPWCYVKAKMLRLERQEVSHEERPA